jgi:hypothetical protein
VGRVAAAAGVGQHELGRGVVWARDDDAVRHAPAWTPVREKRVGGKDVILCVRDRVPRRVSAFVGVEFEVVAHRRPPTKAERAMRERETEATATDRAATGDSTGAVRARVRAGMRDVATYT